MTEIKLYGYSTSPFVRKLGCCLYYKKIPFEFIPVNPIDPQEIAFSNQTQVPVLKIGKEWRNDSTSLAIWLDDLFPENPLFGNNDEERESILKLDDWATNSLIVGIFRSIYEAKVSANYRHTAWRLSAIVSSQTPLPEEVRSAWPDFLKLAPFIQQMMADVDSSETIPEMHTRIALELLDNLNGGPFLGGFEQPSLADFAIFPQLVFSYMVGIEQELGVSLEPSLNNWLNRVKAYLPSNPILVPDYIVVNKL